MKNYQALIKPNVLNWFALLIVGCCFLGLPIARLDAVGSNIFDLGIFTSNISNVVSNPFLLVYGHLQPFLYPFGLLGIAFSPNSLVLLILTIQSAVLFLSGVYIAKLLGAFWGLIYFLMPAVWYSLLFDFHLDFITVPILLYFFAASEKSQFLRATVAAVSLILVKEVYALTTIACGIYLLFSCFQIGNFKQKKIRFNAFAATFLILAGGFYCYAAFFFVQPFFGVFGRGVVDSPTYNWMGKSIFDILVFLLSHPITVLTEIIQTKGKLLFLFVLFGSVGFISLLSPRHLIVLAPTLLASLLSRHQGYYDFTAHYTSSMIAPTIFAAYHGRVRFVCFLSKFSSIFQMIEQFLVNKIFVSSWIFICALSVNVLLSPSPISRYFWSLDHPRFGATVYLQNDRETMINSAIMRHIPEDIDVVVSSQNNLNNHRISTRKVVGSFPNGVNRPFRRLSYEEISFHSFFGFINSNDYHVKTFDEYYADYIIVDRKRPLFLVDQGCEWINGVCSNDDIVKQFNTELELARKSYATVYMNDGFEILKKSSHQTSGKR